MAGSGVGGIGGFGGPSQIINGQTYALYSPAWYAAMHADAQRQAAATGTAAGTTIKAAADAAGVPILGSSTSSSSSTGSGAASGSAYPTVTPPSIAGLTAAAAGGGGTGVSTGTGSGGGSTGYSRIAPVDTTEAENASFAKAKDQVGQESSGALTGLRSALASRGLLGGGLEERATASAANAAAGQLGDVSRQQAVTRADLAQQNAQTNYQGAITQRGQDFQKEEAGNSLAGQLALGSYQGQITQRGQDIQAANAAKALEIEQAQLAAQQRSTALAGLESALKITAPSGLMY